MAQRRNLDETRGQILDAGAEILEESGLSIGTGEVSLIDACRRAGLRTAGSGYKLWSTQDDFRDDVLRHMFENVDVSVMLPTDLIDKLVASGPDASMLELVRIGSIERARVISESPAFTRSVALWLAAGNDPELARLYREALLNSVDVVAELYRDLIEVYERELIEPFTVELFALAIVSQACGLGLHDSIVEELGADDLQRPTGPDGAMQRWHLLGCVTDALTRSYSRPKGTSDTDVTG